MSKLGVTELEMEKGLSPKDIEALSARIHSWLVHGLGLNLDTMEFRFTIESEIALEQARLGVHITERIDHLKADKSLYEEIEEL